MSGDTATKVIDLMEALKRSLTRPCQCGHPWNEHRTDSNREGPCRHCSCATFAEPPTPTGQQNRTQQEPPK